MELTARDLAAIFKVPESLIYRWINEDGLPSRQIDGRPFFNQTELLEWAITRRLSFSPAMLRDDRRASDGNVSKTSTALADVISNNGEFLRLEGKTKTEVLTEMVERMALPERSDRENLLRLFLSREVKGSTSVGDGIAIPHPQHPVILPVTAPSICVCYLESPVDFGSLDGLPIHTMFTIVCPTIRSHLRMLARVAMALRDAGFRSAIVKRAPRETIVREAERVDRATAATLPTPKQATSLSETG